MSSNKIKRFLYYQSPPKNRSVIHLIKKGLYGVLCVAIVLELILFPDLENIAGITMAVTCLWIFNQFFLKRSIILRHPFSFLMFLSMFIYRYIPLIATLMEGKPISYGFENPLQTFMFETILFIISSLSFYFACVFKFRPTNNVIQKKLYRFGFFQTDIPILWGMGTVGIAAHLYLLAVGGAEYGDVAGKFLAGLIYLIYAPLILLFPRLAKIDNKKLVWGYFFLIVILSLASNSRHALIAPLGTVVLLYLFHIIRVNASVTHTISPTKIVVAVFIVIVMTGLLSDISMAMLANRGIRDNVSRLELVKQTWQTWQDDEQMQKIRALTKQAEVDKGFTYWDGWTESYIDNFMLNRFGNMRISDQTIYYANRVGWGNEKMRDDFLTKVIATYPTNLLAMIGIQIDKRDLEYSPGDYLYSLATGTSSALGGYRVTSHIGDGLATWGYGYFPLQFVLFYLVFKLLNCLVFYTKKTVLYSPYGLMSVFFFLGMFRNAAGCLTEIGYVLRGFWQHCFIYIIVFYALSILFNRVKQY